MSDAQPNTVDLTQMTRQQRAALPLSTDVAQAIAEQHGVCVRPLAMRRIDTTTGRVDVVPVPCGSTREEQCRPCAEKARRLRMAQCREGWHLDEEPVIERAAPSDQQKELMATRADLVSIYGECRTIGDETTCEQIADSVAELDDEIRASGIRGRLTRWTHHLNRCAAPPNVARMPRTCPVDESNGAPWGRSSRVATGPPPS